MDIVIISSLATACILTAVEGLLRPLGKFRGLAALILSMLFCFNFKVAIAHMIAYTLATTFIGLTLSLLVEQLFIGTSSREMRGLPKRIDKR